MHEKYVRKQDPACNNCPNLGYCNTKPWICKWTGGIKEIEKPKQTPRKKWSSVSGLYRIGVKKKNKIKFSHDYE